MANDFIHINDAETGEIIERELTDKEQAEYDADKAALAAIKIEEDAAKKELRLTKITAYKKLGLTDAEIEALLPTPFSG